LYFQFLLIGKSSQANVASKIKKQNSLWLIPGVYMDDGVCWFCYRQCNTGYNLFARHILLPPRHNCITVSANTFSFLACYSEYGKPKLISRYTKLQFVTIHCTVPKPLNLKPISVIFFHLITGIKSGLILLWTIPLF
jgi:hypothetical protein